MTPLDTDLQKVAAMIVGATAEFACALGATTAALAGTAAYPYQDFGSVKVFDLDAQPETTPRITAVRGSRRQKGTTPTLTKLIYKLTCNEADALKMGILYSGESLGDLTQTVLAATAGAPLEFSATAKSKAGHWYDLRKSDGSAVREVSAVTIATKVEGTDFVVDKRLGRIRFITEQAAELTPTITAAAITAADTTSMARIKPMTTPVRSGIGRLVVFDKNASNNVVLDHRDFSCDIVVDSGPGSQDGTGEAAIVILVTVTFEAGELLVRN